jgi:hypothetical protein
MNNVTNTANTMRTYIIALATALLTVACSVHVPNVPRYAIAWDASCGTPAAVEIAALEDLAPSPGCRLLATSQAADAPRTQWEYACPDASGRPELWTVSAYAWSPERVTGIVWSEAPESCARTFTAIREGGS